MNAGQKNPQPTNQMSEGKEKPTKAKPVEVTMLDLILENRELKGKIVELTRRIEKLEGRRFVPQTLKVGL